VLARRISGDRPEATKRVLDVALARDHLRRVPPSFVAVARAACAVGRLVVASDGLREATRPLGARGGGKGLRKGLSVGWFAAAGAG